MQTRATMEPLYFDVHSHIQFPSYDADRFEVIRRMKEERVWALVVGTNKEYSAEAAEATSLWEEGLFAAVGAHPTDAASEGFDSAYFRPLLHNHAKVRAIGECGLDFFRREKTSEEAARQKDFFEAQVVLALEFDLPLMLHCRPQKGSMDAYEETLAILRSYARKEGEKLRGNVHFFVGDKEVAKQFLELGFTLSFTGVITFADDYDEIVRYAPLESILSETDCPFVAPAPYRGKRNEPAYVKGVVERIAQIRSENPEKVRSALVANARRVFDIL